MARKTAKNPTLERLAGLPFSTATELKAAQHEVLLAAWTQLERARVIHELTQRDEYGFWREEFARGLVCDYGEDSEELVRVFSEHPGIKVVVNKALAATIPASEAIVGVLVKSLSESFANTYYKAKGILPTDDVAAKDQQESTS